MTVNDLIEALKQLPPDMMVLTDGIKNGYEEIFEPRIMELKHEPDNTYPYGEYQLIEVENEPSIKAVVIPRNFRDD
jgi:hypothetical protein